jgi:hypothetical protein
METWIHGDMDMETWTWRHQKENGAQAIFFNPFTVYSSCKQKFVICPFVDEETNGSYSFVNGLKGLNGLVLLTSLSNL